MGSRNHTAAEKARKWKEGQLIELALFSSVKQDSSTRYPQMGMNYTDVIHRC